MIAGAPSIAATVAFDSPITAPTPAWPVPSMRSDVVVRGERRVGGPDARREVLDDVTVDVGLGEPARDVDRAHDRHRVGQPEHLAHEDRVLVRRDAVLDDRPLADRLHEAGSTPRRQEQPSKSPRLAVVLPRFCPVAAR